MGRTISILTVGKPAYFGMYILGLGTVIMYKFGYEYIETTYGEKSRLLFTGIDSLMY